jgi:glyoxylase-like metal-dependent hydrolase (beta-lactamase superfamily II)
MGKVEQIVKGIYLIAGPNISNPEDAAAFIIDFGDELVMIDSGAGDSTEVIEKNIRSAGLDPAKISSLVLTHCHIDHIGGAPYFQKKFGAKIIVHDLDADAIEVGDPVRTAATWYGTFFPPTEVDKRLKSDHEILSFGKQELHCLHTPGHTPGSICIYLERDNKKVLFGQDIHGPFSASFGSDIEQWKKSMKKLIALEADILCEGHFGIFRSKDKVKKYIQSYLDEYSR